MATAAIALHRRTTAPIRAPTRRALAASAIARQEMSAIEDAISRAERLAWASRTKHETATKQVTAAKAEDAEQLAAALVSGGPSSPQAATQRAREEQLAATDALEAARSAVTRLENDLQEAARAAERANGGVRAAIAAVLKPVAQKMIEEAKHSAPSI